AGLIYAVKLVGDALGLTRPVAHPRSDGLSPGVAARLGPHIAAQTQGGRATGFGASERVDMAEAVLRAMSLTQGFARLVLLAGHGATTVNNP
ncbi:putative inorganic carbon transporter subunit DabA, partial [Acinetobacter baumannii]